VNCGKEIILTKRDGSLELFSFQKLRNCLADVLRHCSYDPALAEPLTRAVAAYLAERRDDRLPSTELVFRCVRVALQQSGLSEVAGELALQRRVRAIRRKALRVQADESAVGGHPWRKARIVATLERRYGLARPTARFVAGQVERQILALKYREVSRLFVRELVGNEVTAWGLGEAVNIAAKLPPHPAPAVPRSEKE
jgi:hypothetical protein